MGKYARPADAVFAAGGTDVRRADVRQSVREEAVVENHTFNIFEKLSEKMKLKQVRANYWTDK